MPALKKQPLNREHEFYIDFLSKVTLFDGVNSNPDALDSLSGYMKSHSFRPGSKIISEGETGTEMYFLIRGEASVMKKTVDGEFYRVAILSSERHAFFGEGGLLESDTRSATIIAETDCECLALSGESFKEFSRDHSQFALSVIFKIANAIMQRLRKANEDLVLIYNALVAEIRGHQ